MTDHGFACGHYGWIIGPYETKLRRLMTQRVFLRSSEAFFHSSPRPMKRWPEHGDI